MTLQTGAQLQLREIASRVRKLKSHLRTRRVPSTDADPSTWYSFLWPIKDKVGSVNVDLSFVGTLLAHRYLRNRYPGILLDASTKSQHAPGLNITARVNGTRIVGELKTTHPYGPRAFGANQHSSFRRDFRKLRRARANRKYLFVTEPETFKVLRTKSYQRYLKGVTVVRLDYGEEFARR
jgi:hypothetical protein